MGNIGLGGSQAILVFFVLFLIVIATILYFRSRFNKISGSNLAEKHAGKSWKSPLEARNKYPDVNAFSMMRPCLLYTSPSPRDRG